MPPSIEERWTRAIEQLSASFERQTELLRALSETQRILNDNFLLHQAKTDQVCEKVNSLDETLKNHVFPLLKWLTIAVIILAGGAEVLRALGIT